MCLNAGDDADREVALASQCTNRGGDGAGGGAGDLAEEAPAVETIRAQPLGDGENDLAVRHHLEERGVQPLCPDREALGVATRAAVATLTREREQVLMLTWP